VSPRGIVSVLFTVALLALSGCPLSSDRDAAQKVPVVVVVDGEVMYREGVLVRQDGEVVAVLIDGDRQPVVGLSAPCGPPSSLPY
jgi:hypothetical protein